MLTANNYDYILSTVSVSQLVRNKFEYKFPILFKKSREKQVVEDIFNDLNEAMKWFEQYDEKIKCINMIKNAKPEDNIAISEKNKNYPIIEKMLLE
jgi:hypothetical protein